VNEGVLLASMALFVMTLMGPESLHARAPLETEGIDIVLAMDLSLSMRAPDIYPNRFNAMKDVVDTFIQSRPSDRLGAVVFGREAYTLAPLTTDKDTLQTMIRDLELNTLDGHGTAIGNALGVALNRLRTSSAKTRVIVLVTDGDSNSGNIAPEQAADFARQISVPVYAILMGQAQTAAARRSDTLNQLLQRKSAETYPANPALLRSIAKKTDGKFFLASDRHALEQSMHSILNRLDKSVIRERGTVAEALYLPFINVAIVLLVITVMLNATVLRRWP